MYSKLFQASDPARLKKLTFRLQAMLGLLESGQIIPGLGTVNLHPGQDLYQASWSGWLLSEQLFWKSMNFVLLKICILLSLFLEPHMSICFYRTILPRFVPRCGFRIHPICKAICNHIYICIYNSYIHANVYIYTEVIYIYMYTYIHIIDCVYIYTYTHIIVLPNCKLGFFLPGGRQKAVQLNGAMTALKVPKKWQFRWWRDRHIGMGQNLQCEAPKI